MLSHESCLCLVSAKELCDRKTVGREVPRCADRWVLEGFSLIALDCFGNVVIAPYIIRILSLILS